MPGPDDPMPQCARWTTRDGMILVAATGIGLAGARETYICSDWSFPGLTYLSRAAPLAQFAMLAWAGALLAIGRHRRRGPAWRTLRSPGLAACAAGLAGAACWILLDGFKCLTYLICGLPSGYYRNVFLYRDMFVFEVAGTYTASGYFVLISWMTQGRDWGLEAQSGLG